MPSPGNSPDDVPLSQVLSLSSSQMEELEMSPGYDNIDSEPLDFSENQQRRKSERETINTGLQGHDSDRKSREKTLHMSESEVVTSDGVAIQGNASLCEKVVSSEKDICCSERGSQTISSRKRPHPDSK